MTMKAALLAKKPRDAYHSGCQRQLALCPRDVMHNGSVLCQNGLTYRRNSFSAWYSPIVSFLTRCYTKFRRDHP